jgi:hypothetical protein
MTLTGVMLLAGGASFGWLVASGRMNVAQALGQKNAKGGGPTKRLPMGDGKKPNIVFILMDNLDYGEPVGYGRGIVRGAPTPRIDSFAAEGTRLLGLR